MRSHWYRWRQRSNLTATRSRRPASRSGGVAHKPWRDPAAEAALRGQRVDAERICAKPPTSLLQGARGYGHNNFKIGLARRAIVRTLSQAARGTPQSQSVKKIR